MKITPIHKLIEIAEEGGNEATRPNWWWKQKISELVEEEKIMVESTKPTLNTAENGNKSKPLLCDVFPINEIELKGGYLEFFDEEIVLKALNNMEKIIDDSLLLTKEDFHVKIRLFLKLKKEMEALHTLTQSENFFNEGMWNYKRESLSRRC